MDRDKIDSKYKWKLEDIYKNLDEYNKNIEALAKMVTEFETYKDRILESDKTLLDTLLIYEKMDITISKLYVYINMKLHEDTRNGEYQELSGNLDIILRIINEKTAFFVPELLLKDYSYIENLIKKNKELVRFEFLLKTIYDEKEHILSKDIEEILSRNGNVLSSADNIFSNLNDADIVFDKIKDENGKTKELTKANYYVYSLSKDRSLRKRVFKTFYKKYAELNNTFASIMNSNLQSSTFLARTRNYKRPINLYLDSNKIDENIYYDLIKSVNDNLDKMADYVKLRKEVLGYKNIHMYDMALKLSDNNETEYTFEDAKELVKKALSPLGDKYISDLSKGMEAGWIDVYENKGKHSGAYSWGCYGTHPYVLLNFQGKYNDVSTLAHEMGHAMHRYYSNLNQDYFYSDNAIFVAEIASTVNEALLNFYMLKNTKDKEFKKSIINEMLDDIKNTIFRQTMFAEFELNIHNMCFDGNAMSADTLNKMYYDLMCKYHKGVVVDDEIKYEWSRIPHFYSSFYVYKYATGFISAIIIVDNLKKDKNYKEKYLNFLKSGGSKYPLDILKDADIDISDVNVMNRAFEIFNEKLNLLKKYIDE